MNIPIEVSARHLHLSDLDCQKLFGSTNLKTKKSLSQPNQFAAEETVKIVGPKSEIADVRIIGPNRERSQLEISITDAFNLGITIPAVLVSGMLDNSAGGLKIVGKSGEIMLNRGVIVAARHLHISPEEAEQFNIKDNMTIKIQAGTTRKVIFDNVIVRSRKNIDKLSFQIDTDEANAAGVKNGDQAVII